MKFEVLNNDNPIQNQYESLYDISKQGICVIFKKGNLITGYIVPLPYLQYGLIKLLYKKY